MEFGGKHLGYHTYLLDSGILGYQNDPVVDAARLGRNHHHNLLHLYREQLYVLNNLSVVVGLSRGHDWVSGTLPAR